MLKLIKLEMIKIKMDGYVRKALIADLIAIVSLGLTIFQGLNNHNTSFTSFLNNFLLIEATVKAIFIIFSSVLISRLIIEEYKTNTISVLFMYPINRKKLIITKMIIVALFTFIGIIISNIFIDFVLYIANYFCNFMPEKLTTALVFNTFITVSINAFISAGIGLIPLFFGMRKKSIVATIVSAIIIVSIVCNKSGGISPSLNMALPIALSFIGAIIAYLSIRNIEHVDIS